MPDFHRRIHGIPTSIVYRLKPACSKVIVHHSKYGVFALALILFSRSVAVHYNQSASLFKMKRSDSPFEGKNSIFFLYKTCLTGTSKRLCDLKEK